jgi:hypothetical protein
MLYKNKISGDPFYIMSREHSILTNQSKMG